MTNSVCEFFPAGREGSIDDQAASWFAYLRSGHDTEAGRRDFIVWLGEDHAHGLAYQAVKDAFEALACVDRVEERLAGAEASVTQPMPRRIRSTRSTFSSWRIAAAAAVAVIVGSGVLGAGLFSGLRSGESEQVQLAPTERLVLQTGIGEVETVSLADGSAVTLSGDTQIEVRLGETRDVTLASGQAFFEVAHDAARPFTVSAGAAEVRVLGTSFDVRHGAEAVIVSVTEGRVRLSPTASAAEGSAPPVFLTPSRQAVMFNDGQVRRGAFDAQKTLAWRQRRFFFEDASLCELMIDVNRFSEKPVSAFAADPCALRVSASFHSDQIDQTLEAVADSLGLDLIRTSDRLLLVATDG